MRNQDRRVSSISMVGNFQELLIHKPSLACFGKIIYFEPKLMTMLCQRFHTIDYCMSTSFKTEYLKR